MEYIITNGVSGMGPSLQVFNQIKGEYILSWVYKETMYVETILTYKPDINQIKNIIIDFIEKEVDKNVEFGFVYKGTPVHLNKENEDNFFKAFVFGFLENMSGQNFGIFPVPFKLGTPEKPEIRMFNDFSEVKEFCLSAFAYKKGCIAEGFKLKQEIPVAEFMKILDPDWTPETALKEPVAPVEQPETLAPAETPAPAKSTETVERIETTDPNEIAESDESEEVASDTTTADENPASETTTKPKPKKKKQ